MYYEPYQKKKKTRQPRRRRKPFGAWLAELCLRLFALLLALAMLGVGLLYLLPVSLFAVEPDGAQLSLTDGLPADRANVLLLGLDALHQGSRRSDSIMIASIGGEKLKLISVLRDAELNIPGFGVDKLNAAYAHGGAELVMRTLNESLKLNIMHYLAVDFRGLVRVVDALGGVELEITEAEMEAINRLLDSGRARFEAAGVAAPPLSACGEGTRLNGAQALCFARLRKLDSDFMRASRQRRLLNAMLKKLRAGKFNPLLIARLIPALSQSIETNMSAAQLVSYGLKALATEALETLRLPADGSYTDDGSRLIIDDLQANVAATQLFIYD